MIKNWEFSHTSAEVAFYRVC